MAIDRATDDAGSGGDVAHSGVGVLSQHIEGDHGFTCDPGFTNCTVLGARGTAGRLVMPGP